MIEQPVLQSLLKIGPRRGSLLSRVWEGVTTGANRRLIKPYGWVIWIWLKSAVVCRALIDSAVGSASCSVPRTHSPWHCGLLLAPLFDIEIPELLEDESFLCPLCNKKRDRLFGTQRSDSLRVRMRLPKGKKQVRWKFVCHPDATTTETLLWGTTEWRRTKLFRKENNTQWKTESRLNGNFGKHRVLENCGSVWDDSDCSLVHQKPLSNSLRVVDVPRSVYCVTFV